MEARDAAVELVANARDWIVEGRNGSADARGMLFERCRQYLLLVAERELDPGLRAKLGASDLVQQTFLEAERGFGRFRGQSDEELRAWLHRILRNRAAQEVRRFRSAAKRDVRCEQPLSSCGADGLPHRVASDVETPSRQLQAAEEESLLLCALSRLPEHYRNVIQLRNNERKSFEEIGELLGRSAEAARKLWVRAIDQLRTAMTDKG